MDEEQKKADTNDASKDPAADAVAALKKCEELRDEYLNGWKRSAADFINYKKDEAKRFSEFANFSNQALVRELLPVLDSFQLALSVVKGDESAQRGLTMIQSQLDNVLKQQGVERITVKSGDAFDPALHEAMVEEDVKEKPELSGKIVEELAAGYTLNGKVIRATKVKVAK